MMYKNETWTRQKYETEELSAEKMALVLSSLPSLGHEPRDKLRDGGHGGVCCETLHSSSESTGKGELGVFVGYWQ